MRVILRHFYKREDGELQRVSLRLETHVVPAAGDNYDVTPSYRCKVVSRTFRPGFEEVWLTLADNMGGSTETPRMREYQFRSAGWTFED